jgi:hypothetical protein
MRIGKPKPVAEYEATGDIERVYYEIRQVLRVAGANLIMPLPAVARNQDRISAAVISCPSFFLSRQRFMKVFGAAPAQAQVKRPVRPMKFHMASPTARRVSPW